MGWPSNESGPDVKLGSKRQGRYRLAGLGKAGRGQSRPRLMAKSLRLTVNGFVNLPCPLAGRLYRSICGQEPH